MVLLIGAPASAQLLEENFTGTVGTLLTTTGWTNSSGTTNFLAITSPGLTFTGYAPSGIGNATTITNSGEDVYKSFSAVNSGSVYLSFMINVASAGSGDYLMAFSPSTLQTNYYARFSIKSGTTGFNVGISKSNETKVYGTTEFLFNTTYLAVVKYTFSGTATDTTDDPISVYLLPDGTSLTSEPTTPELNAYTTATKNDAVNLGFVTIRQGSSTPNASIGGIRVSTSWNAIASPWNKVTFNLNTCTSQDTIRPATAKVQVRGDTYPLTWGDDALTMTNIGGDYWRATATFVNGTSLNYKYYVNTWANGDNTAFTVTKDTVFSLAYFNNGTTPPYTAYSDSIDVWFRINMGSLPSFTPGTDVVGVRGDRAPLDWGNSLMLTREGTTKFYSGVGHFASSWKDSTVSYKYVVNSGGWESLADNRTFVAKNDTTLAWVTYNNDIIAPPDTVNVTFLINTSTIPDTLLTTSTVQLRGSLPTFTWDNNSVLMTNIGGDYWKVKVPFLVGRGTTLNGQFKVFTNVKSSIDGSDNGWENNSTDGSGNRLLSVGPVNGPMDTVLILQYANGSPTAQPQYWRPYVPTTDSVAVMFRINMQSQETFNKTTTKLGVRGSLPPLDWGKSIFLTQEANHGNAGQTGYDGTNFWSVVVKFPRTALATVAQYKFVQHALADSAHFSPAWEGIDNRTFNFDPVMPDTTLYWKWWNNQIMLPFSGQDTVIMTFRADLAQAVAQNGAAYTDTIVVRSGYNASAVVVREKRMFRVGISSKFQAIDTVVTKSSTSLYYQYYRLPSSGEVREIYYNFANPGASATAEKRRFMVPANANNTFQMVQDTINSTSAEHRMPRFRNMRNLSKNVLVTYTCDVRPAIYQLKKGSQLISTNITNYVISDPDSVKFYGVWMNGPAVGGWDIGGAWGADRRLIDTAKMWDNGTHGDLVSGDSIYSLQYSYTTAATIGQEFKFGIYGCDNEGGFGNNHIENIDDANATATMASQFGSIDPVFFNAWDYTNQRPTLGVNDVNIPLAYKLDQNYPNPFNPSTKIDYELKEAGFVSLKVFNILGQVVTTLAAGKQEAGKHQVTFDASQLSSGVYLYQITAGNFVAIKKMVLMK